MPALKLEFWLNLALVLVTVWWEQRGYFKSASDNGRTPFVVSMPPPNVTGQLHLGHAMFVALEDLMIRYQRMCGRPVLWVPGSDHAGIATQLQVENHLLRTEEVTREELGREEFVRRTWEWKQKYGEQWPRKAKPARNGKHGVGA